MHCAKIACVLLLFVGHGCSSFGHLTEGSAWLGEVLGAETGKDGPRKPVLTIDERDEDGGRHRVPRFGGIVDVNSRLVVRIDQGELRRRSAQRFGADKLDDKQIAALFAIHDAAQKGLEHLPAMTRALQVWAESTKDDAAQKALAEGMKPVTSEYKTIKKALDEFEFLGSKAAFNEFIASYDGFPSVAEQYAFYLQLAARRAEELRTDLTRSLAAKGIFVQLGAWIATGGGTTPVHLPGFDDYPEGDYFRVDRVVVNLDEEQQKQFEGYANAAKEIEQKGVEPATAAKRVARSFLNSIRADFEKHLQKIAADARATVQAAEASADANVRAAVATVKARIAKVSAAVDDYREYLGQLEAKYRSNATATQDPLAFLSDVRADFAAVVERTKQLAATVAGVQGDIEQIGAELKSAAGTLAKSANDLSSLAEELVNAMGLQARLLLAGRQINRDVLTMGEEVKRLSIDQVPDETELNLLRTGAREPGDKLLFRIAIGRGDDPKSRKIVEENELAMYQVLAHVTSTPLLMFANPSGQANQQTDFATVPAYSVLLKRGSRSSSFYNRFIDAGIGFSFAALDFNGDDQPELGVAATVSILRDWIQVGGGYNFGDDRGFWFVGGAVPISSLIGDR
ncbi:MAG: apolipoprotein A1/A4/E family protein [bacterium]|nr:apolipoprotein A1/A4/E family protein [bacterium]